MAKIIAKIGNAVRKVGTGIGLYPECCCGSCCEYGPIFPLDFHATGNDFDGNPFDVSGTLVAFIWQDELGNILTLGPCTEIPEENNYFGSIPGFAVSFTPAGSAFAMFGGIATQYIENWPCDQIKNIAGSSAYLVGAFNVTSGSVTFS